jgi:uncharacterized repeat protein (TIGR03803 family)
MPRFFGSAVAVLIGTASVIALSASAEGANYRVLYSFCHQGKFVCADGKNPAANLVADAAGNLYGTTSAGGSTGNGVVFELVRSGRKYSYQVLHSFDGAADGGVPVTPLIIDTAGNLYGTATADGANFGGTAFELSPNGGKWTYTVLTSFCSTAGDGCVQGQVPESPLTYSGQSSGQPYDGTSPLYGTTLEGGPNGVGVAYSLTPSGGSWSGAAIYSFCSVSGCADGEFPVGQLVLDTHGNLYGTTAAGGNANGNGVAYRLATATGQETVLHAFCSAPDCTDGNDPLAGLTLADRNELFGATIVGGKHGSGTVYKLHGKSGKENVLYSFCRKPGCADGIGPSSPVELDNGALVGTAGGGDGSSDGVVYRIGAANDESVLYTFCQQAGCKDGATPIGVISVGGSLFGVTQRGGNKNDGVVFELTP